MMGWDQLLFKKRLHLTWSNIRWPGKKKTKWFLKIIIFAFTLFLLLFWYALYYHFLQKDQFIGFFSTDYRRIFNSSTRRTKYIKYCFIYFSAIFAEEFHDRPSSIGGRMQKCCCIWRFVRLIIDETIIVVNSLYLVCFHCYVFFNYKCTDQIER